MTRELGPPKFALGRTLVTPGALAALEAVGQSGLLLLLRHQSGDYGEILSQGDVEANENALLHGSRILSAYQLEDGTKLWVITEAADEDGFRAATTILKPEEY